MDSPLFLNQSVRSAEQWNEAAINNRANVLAERALKVWPAPALADDVLAVYKEPETSKNEVQYSIEDYDYFKDEMLELYQAF